MADTTATFADAIQGFMGSRVSIAWRGVMSVALFGTVEEVGADYLTVRTDAREYDQTPARSYVVPFDAIGNIREESE